MSKGRKRGKGKGRGRETHDDVRTRVSQVDPTDLHWRIRCDCFGLGPRESYDESVSSSDGVLQSDTNPLLNLEVDVSSGGSESEGERNEGKVSMGSSRSAWFQLGCTGSCFDSRGRQYLERRRRERRSVTGISCEGREKERDATHPSSKHERSTTPSARDTSIYPQPSP